MISTTKNNNKNKKNSKHFYSITIHYLFFFEWQKKTPQIDKVTHLLTYLLTHTHTQEQNYSTIKE